jgi:hypothetical protein
LIRIIAVILKITPETGIFSQNLYEVQNGDPENALVQKVAFNGSKPVKEAITVS